MCYSWRIGSFIHLGSIVPSRRSQCNSVRSITTTIDDSTSYPKWDIQMIASDLEFRYADLTGDVFQVRDDWTILQLLDGYRPDWRIRQYNYRESSLLVPGSQQPFILRLTCHKVRQGVILTYRSMLIHSSIEF